MATRKLIASQRAGLYSTPSFRGKNVSGTNYFIGAVLTSTTAQGGFIMEAGANPTKILGVAESRGGNDADSSTYVRFVPALPHIIFEGTLLGSSNTQVALTDTMLWQDFGITKDGTESWYVDVSKNGVNARVRVVDFVDDTGTVDARVRFIFIAPFTLFAQT